MELNSPWIRYIGRNFKPLGSLDAVLTTSNKVNNTLRIKPTSVGNCLEEDAVQFVDFCSVLGSFCWRLVDRFESDQVRLATQRRTNLVPQSVKLLFN